MSSGRRRFFAPQALGADEYLRATWHADKRVVVFSHWTGSECTAAMPVRVEELRDLATLLVEALGHEVQTSTPGSSTPVWAPPAPGSRAGDLRIPA